MVWKMFPSDNHHYLQNSIFRKDSNNPQTNGPTLLTLTYLKSVITIGQNHKRSGEILFYLQRSEFRASYMLVKCSTIELHYTHSQDRIYPLSFSNKPNNQNPFLFPETECVVTTLGMF